jgi:plasmid maintenance system killer protein
MIRSFRCADNQALASGWALRGDRAGQHSMRINDR